MAALHGVVATRKKPSKKMTKRNQSAIRSVMRKLRNMQYQTQQKNLLNTTETNKLYSEIEEEILLLLLSFTPILEVPYDTLETSAGLHRYIGLALGPAEVKILSHYNQAPSAGVRMASKVLAS